MKTIHLLPTKDKAKIGMLVKTPEGYARLNEIGVQFHNDASDPIEYELFHMYITSSESIHKFDCVIADNGVYRITKTNILFNGEYTLKVSEGIYINPEFASKIAFSTNEGIGVEAVSEEILERFCKEPFYEIDNDFNDTIDEINSIYEKLGSGSRFGSEFDVLLLRAKFLLSTLK